MANTSTTTATISVLDVYPVNGHRDLLALADVELLLDGVPIVLHGVQVRADANRTEIALPKYRCTNGSWRAAVSLPEEVRGVMGDAVIAAALEKGILRERS